MVTGPEIKRQRWLWGSAQHGILMPAGKRLPGLLGGFFPCLLHTNEGKMKKKKKTPLNSTECMIDLI